jgi:flagellar hook protein FlgE
MMSQAFYSGITGLQTNSTGINVIADNLSNVSTVGFRGYNVEFSSMFEKMINTDSGGSSVNSSVGVGTKVQTASMLQKNGSLQLSDRSTDLAIDGNGWFGVQGKGAPIYTRDGTFNFDVNNDLVSLDGYHVLGTMGGNISANNVLTNTLSEIALGNVGAQQKLRFPKTLTFPPVPTSKAKFLANIGVTSTVRTISASVVDANSNKNELRLEFTKDATQNPPGSQWSVKATTQTLDANTIYDTKFGSVNFDASGGLVSTTLTSIDNNGTPVTMDLGSGYNGIVSINRPVVSGSTLSDGTIGGDLKGYAINKNAEVIATFTNGKQSSVGKIALFHFRNEQGLERLSGTKFQASSNSGDPLFFKDANGKSIIGANVINFKTETSNYDMTSGLTELIAFQRAYDASSKSITTADQMIQKALSMHK